MKERSFVPPKRYDRAGDGRWSLGPESRVVFSQGGMAEAARCVELVGKDHPSLAAAPRKLPGEEPQAGDLVVRVGQPEELEGVETFQEGYVIRIGAAAELTAQTHRGLMYGLRTLMELAEGGGLPHGLIADWPDTAERGLHLDMGRKYFTQEWIAERIRDMSRNRMNTLWLHFSETEGFRIACDSHPEVPSLLHLGKDEVRRLIKLANEWQIDVNPALDSPGHLGQALRERPTWQLPRRDGERLHSALDITNPQAKRFLLDLLDEYMELFSGSKVFHIGGDEFIDFRDFSPYPVMDVWAREHLGPEYTGVDTYVCYLNEIAAYVRARGFQVRVWSDGLLRRDVEQRVELDREVQIAYWTRWDEAMAPIQDFLDQGYQLVNYHSGYLYYILLQIDWYTDPDGDRLLAQWDPSVFPDANCRGGEGGQILPAESRDRLLGSCFSIWCDWPHLQGQEEVDRRSRDALRAMGMRCWSWKKAD